MKRISIAIALAVFFSNYASADWLAFRGSNSNGVAADVAPRKCNEESVAWSVDVPGRSVSSPIVVGDQVIVTASSGVNEARLHVISYDAGDGSKNWHRQFWATGRTLFHPTSSNAAPSPASDGTNIVAFFSSNDVICLGIDGDLKWLRGLANDHPKLGNDIGMASSPMIADGVVVCQAECQGDSFVEALKVSDGTTLWQIDRPKDSNWTSPVHLPSNDGTDGMVLLKCDEYVAAHGLQTGDEIWRIDAELGGTPCMVVTEDRIYVPGSTFLALDRDGNSANVAWDSGKLKTSPSPIVTDDKIVFINSAGVLKSHDAKDGRFNWQVRVGGKYWASPLMDKEGYIYTFNDSGTMTIVNTKGKKVASHQFDATIMGTPAISDGAIYIRGVKKLWKVVSR